jgi:hypothetical protein
MNKTHLLMYLIAFSFINSSNAQRISNCNVDAWIGRKTNFKIEKIAVYTGNDFKNAPVSCYERISEKQQVWKKNEKGVMCLVETMRNDSTFIVTDTLKCRDFKVYYWVSYRDLVTKGKKVKMQGFCPDKMTNDLMWELVNKLSEEGLLLEMPDDTIPNWDHVIPIAVMKYQQKYDLAVGLLTIETAKHMKLHF